SLPFCAEWGLIEKLKYEKDVIGIYLTSHPLDNYRFEITHFCQHPVRLLALIDKMKETEVDEELRTEFNKIKNRELTIGGMVTSANHRVTKNGKPFGVLVFEDYSDSYEIALFGEDYVKMKGYLNEGYFIQVKGIIQERFRQPGNWGFEVKSMQLLSDLRDKLAKCLTMQVPLHELNDGFVNRIQHLVHANIEQHENTTCQLKFAVRDFESEISVEMPSKGLKISPSNDFIEALMELNGVNYKLN